MAGNFTAGHDVTAAELNKIVGVSGNVTSDDGSTTATINQGTGFTVAYDSSNGTGVKITFPSGTFTNSPLVVATVQGQNSAAIIHTPTVSSGAWTVLISAFGSGNLTFMFHAREMEIGS